MVRDRGLEVEDAAAAEVAEIQIYVILKDCSSSKNSVLIAFAARIADVDAQVTREGSSRQDDPELRSQKS